MPKRPSKTGQGKRLEAQRPANRNKHAQLKAAQTLALAGDYPGACAAYETLLTGLANAQLRGLACNDLGVLAALEGDLIKASERFLTARAEDENCGPAKVNLEFLGKELQVTSQDGPSGDGNSEFEIPESEPCRVAILSFLFNWPSTGGGITHTVELAKFLAADGYRVKHFFAQKTDWGIGNVDSSLPIDSEALEFDDRSWTVSGIQAAYRTAVDRFDPDYVIITDAWNFKPLLAEAMAGYPYILRQQALELLCPLNNLRLLPAVDGKFTQCPLHQLATPDACNKCLVERDHLSGQLHRAERELAGVGTPQYVKRLREVLQRAEAVLVLNPILESILSPFANNVRVVTWGMDSRRFPWPWDEEPQRHAPPDTITFIMAGLVQEAIKGFDVLQEACELLWQRRRDFLLVATGDPVGQFNEFTRFIGWASQSEIPGKIRAADVLVVPTVAQDGLSRTSVEAMAVGRPVIGSRIGGLPFTIFDGATGLLFEPGNPVDLACKMERLLEDKALRQRMGAEGRRRFEDDFVWEQVIERGYRPLLNKKRQGAHAIASGGASVLNRTGP